MGRWLLIGLATFGGVMLIMTIGLLVLIANAERSQPTANANATALPTPGPMVVPTRPITVGTTLRMLSDGRYGYTVVWVNRAGLAAWDRAYDERDDKGMSSVMDLYERLDVIDGTLVRIVAIDGGATQIEMLEGTFLGRRGWTYTGSLKP